MHVAALTKQVVVPHRAIEERTMAIKQMGDLGQVRPQLYLWF
jgi:hypothetical protein